MLEAFKVELFANDHARIASHRNVFIRFRGQWEWYTVLQSGESRGLEMFVQYIEEPARVAILDQAVRTEHARRHTFAAESE